MGRTRQSADLVSDNNIFVDISNDKVGIGTTAPSEQLTVSGITSTSNLNVVGVTTATSFDGNLNASQLASGTIPDARFPSTLPAVDGSQLTGLNVPAGYGDLDALLFT